MFAAPVTDDAQVLALVDAVDRVSGLSRARLADVLQWVGSPGKVLAGDVDHPDVSESELQQLRDAYQPADVERWLDRLNRLTYEDPDIALCTIVSPHYPTNLLDIVNRPPYVFVKGSLTSADERAVAVVGTRTASEEGITIASDLAGALADADVTVVSGLARGIDGAAHAACLNGGGRTVAVLGHGLARPAYPGEHRSLAERIVDSGRGALVSQFPPDAPPTRQTFPMRNVVTSGLSLGTVVVEAGSTSGAKQQADRCMQHGRLLFLVERLVLDQEWAKRAAARPGVVVVHSVDDIIRRIEPLLKAGTTALEP